MSEHDNDGPLAAALLDIEMPGTRYFTLDDQHQPIPCPDMLAWSAFCFSDKASVGISHRADGAYVSTKFFGIHVGDNYKLDFETMAFDKAGGVIQQMRCHEWDEAVRQHAAVCALVGIEP